jgi:hypothetical protein
VTHPTQAEHDMTPVGVYLTNPEALISAANARMGKRRQKHATFITRTLLNATPVDLVGFDESRLYILIQAGGANVVVCTDLSQAQDPANAVPGVPNPNGLLLTAGNTMPYPIEGSQRMWVVGNTFPSQVTCTVMHEAT